MAARRKSPARKKPAARKGAARGKDATALLRADHAMVLDLFEQFEKARGETRKRTLAEKICRELRIHTQIEEEILYPAAREAMREAKQDLLDEAEVEHASAKDLIAQIESGDPSDDLYDAKVKVLGEYIDHHVKEEHGEMFPELRKTKLDLKEIGAQLAARKAELQAGGSRQARGAAALTGSRRAARGPKTGNVVEGESFMAGLAREIGLKR